VDAKWLRVSLTVTSRHVGGRGRPQGDSTWRERTKSFPSSIRCENSCFQAAEVSQRRTAVSSKCFQLCYTCSDRLLVIALPPYPFHLFPLLLWRFPTSQLVCVHYSNKRKEMLYHNCFSTLLWNMPSGGSKRTRRDWYWMENISFWLMSMMLI
jgi:hypothetical protein